MELQANIPHGSVSSQTIALMTAVYSFYMLRGGERVFFCFGTRMEVENGEQSRKSVKMDDELMEYKHGGFLTWVYPQIIHFDLIFLDQSWKASYHQMNSDFFRAEKGFGRQQPGRSLKESISFLEEN